jgi:hypothetical protein
MKYIAYKKKKRKNICFILLEYFSNVKFRIFSIVKVTLEDCKVTSHKNQKNDKYPLVLGSEYSILSEYNNDVLFFIIRMVGPVR